MIKTHSCTDIADKKIRLCKVAFNGRRIMITQLL